MINGAQERVELVARITEAETGFKDLPSSAWSTRSRENPCPPRMLQINSKFILFDPSTLDATMSVEVNANLGKGNDMVRMMADSVGDQAGPASPGGSDGFEQPDLRAD